MVSDRHFICFFAVHYWSYMNTRIFIISTHNQKYKRLPPHLNVNLSEDESEPLRLYSQELLTTKLMGRLYKIITSIKITFIISNLLLNVTKP